MHPYLAEFIGTAILLFMGNGVVANVVLPKTKGHNGGWIVITLGWGMAVFVAVWCVGPVSGAHLNPAVTLGLAMADKFAWGEAAGYMASQMAGGFFGAVLAYLYYRDHYAEPAPAATKLATFCTAPAIRNTVNNLFCEILGTFLLVLAVLWAAEPMVTRPETGLVVAGEPLEHGMKLGLGALGALPVGLLVLAIGLSLGGTTGYAINPARDLSPRLAHALLPIPDKGSSNWDYAWIPVVGPMIGGALAAWLAKLVSQI